MNGDCKSHDRVVENDMHRPVASSIHPVDKGGPLRHLIIMIMDMFQRTVKRDAFVGTEQVAGNYYVFVLGGTLLLLSRRRVFIVRNDVYACGNRSLKNHVIFLSFIWHVKTVAKRFFFKHVVQKIKIILKNHQKCLFNHKCSEMQLHISYSFLVSKVLASLLLRLHVNRFHIATF